jgi:hypothetical protein
MLGQRLELVADSMPCVEKRVRWRATIDFVAQLPHEHVDRAIARALPPPPDPLHQLLSRDDAPMLLRECIEEPELSRRQVRTFACTSRGSISSSSSSIASPRVSSCARTPRRAAARTRATSSCIENGLTR